MTNTEKDLRDLFARVDSVAATFEALVGPYRIGRFPITAIFGEWRLSIWPAPAGGRWRIAISKLDGEAAVVSRLRCVKGYRVFCVAMRLEALAARAKAAA